MCDTLFPILRRGARVVILCDSEGTLGQVPGQKLREQLAATDIDRKKLNKLVDKYLSDVKNNRQEQEGWPKSAYVTSKVFLTALTRVLQKEVHQAGGKKMDIAVNACFPGRTRTELTRGVADISAEEGAECPVFLATMPLHAAPKGCMFWRDGTEVDWTKEGDLANDHVSVQHKG